MNNSQQTRPVITSTMVGFYAEGDINVHKTTGPNEISTLTDFYSE
jgi:hypothetical protein